MRSATLEFSNYFPDLKYSAYLLFAVLPKWPLIQFYIAGLILHVHQTVLFGPLSASK